MTAETQLLRPHAEQLFPDELTALERADDRPRPPQWRLSPWAVTTYVLGGEADGATITPKYVGRRRLVELAVATLATDRALLLLGVPGTAKTWLSEHLAAAISGDSTLIVQGTAGTPEEALRYGWNYARLLAEGPSRDALVPGPVFRAMESGRLARVEELTRIPSDVQDALITILSEKSLPIPELDDEVQAIQGFNVIATANDRDRGVNELSSAMRRRFNTVVLPLPDSADEEVEIVTLRLDAIGGALELPPATSALEEIRRVVTIFRELRSGVTEDGRTKLKSPTGTLSTAEAISVVTNGLALATHFGDGKLTPEDVAGGLTGAVVQDPVQDRVVWQEYLEAVVRERDGWGALYRACRELTHTVFGIRHHGPGSARSLERALTGLQPDAVLIEGPPECDALLGLAAEAEPPVALLTYVPDDPARAAFYPFARFSPEWRAIGYAQEHDVPVRFMDLPAANKMATRDDEPRRGLRADPLAALAEVAGHGDPERWWEDVVESRHEGAFEAVVEAMAALREAFPEHDDGEERREAYMRQSIRAEAKAGATNVAVVCGAWHAPAIAELGPAAPDQRTLRGLPKVKVAATWVPWTYGLLARDSGYGAGVDSPAWYDQLFDETDHPVARWLSRAARLLREEGLDASAAQVVDATRLAGALAGIRDRPLAGLDELLDATRAVLCHGSDVPLELVRRELVVGTRLGEVPPETPMVPLQQDVARLQRRLRLKPEASIKELTLDLRRPNDRERSRLLHRLNLLEVPWGTPAYVSGALGTFKEAFRLEWQPSLALDLIHASRWGTTVETAAAAKARAQAAQQESIAALAALTDAVLLADLPDALGDVLKALSDQAALDRDTADLMGAVPPLAGILRYGDVRGSDTTAVASVLRGIVLRSAVGLPGAGVGADEEAGAKLAELVDGVNSALALLQDDDLTRAFREALRRVSTGDRLPGILAGRATRLLYDAGETDPSAAMSRALSPGEDPERGASWIEGFIGTSGLVLVHDPDLLAILDGWIATVTPDAFTNVLPLLRRAFSVLPAGERRRLGERLREPKGDSPLYDVFIDEERARPALTTVARLLGA